MGAVFQIVSCLAKTSRGCESPFVVSLSNHGALSSVSFGLRQAQIERKSEAGR
jgi:hypothetical protein